MARRAFQAMEGAPDLRVRDDFPILGEATEVTQFDPHYTYLDGWAARRIAAMMPPLHVDVASRLSFAIGLSAFVPVTFVDIRQAEVDLDGFRGIHGSVTELPFADGTLVSLSCLHVIEHVGLGRYGDSLDPDGTRRAAMELARALAPGGQLALGLPVGRPRVQFNAQRIHDPVSVPEMFPGLRLQEFAGVDDDGVFRENIGPSDLRDADYACGCYRFVRPPST